MALNHHIVLAVVALTAASASSLLAQDNPLDVQQQGNISYVTGGIGKDESDALRATQSIYNLRIMNADKYGHFSGDTRIVISDMQHNTLLEATSGPLFYASLPKGRYIVEGYKREQVKKQTISIANAKPSHIRFLWPEDMNNTPNY